MKKWLVPLLRCPQTGSALTLADGGVDGGSDDVQEGVLVTADGTGSYPIIRGVPRFVPQDNYASSFGLQWNRFSRRQLDSYSGHPISRTRFFSYSGWSPADLEGRLVLDVGCGAGRFTEVALDAGARVVAMDYSNAVDACRANHGASPDVSVVQGDLYRMPFQPASFDYVFCFGVLQHTPDVHGAFAALPPMLRPGGRLAVDVYPRLWKNLIWSKYWLRPITRRMDPQTLLRLVERWAPRLLPLSSAIAAIPGAGRQLRYVIPVANYAPDYPLDSEQLVEWAVLDTFDMLSPQHDHPQSLKTLRGWFEAAGLEEVWTGRLGFNVGRGRRPEGGDG